MIEINYFELDKPGKLLLKKKNFQISDLGKNQAFCKTLYSAISPGTELSAYKGETPLIPGKAYPRVLGYCNIGKVIRKGSNFNQLDENDIILTFQSHRSHFVLEKTSFYFKLGKLNIDDIPKYCNLYLYHLGYHSLLSSNFFPGKNIGIVGGTLGYITAELSSIFGCNSYLFTNQDENFSLLVDRGVKIFKKFFVEDNIKDELDVIINTSNSWSDWKFILKQIGHNGEVINLGFPGRGEGRPDFNPLEPKYFYYKNLTIKALKYLPEKYQSNKENRLNLNSNLLFLKSLIENKKINPYDIITDIVTYENLEKLYEKYLIRSSQMFSSLIKWDD